MRGATARATAVSIVNATETTALSGIPAAGNSSTIIDQAISGVVNITAGAGTTAVVVKCKNAAATQVGTSQTHTLAATASANIPFCFLDSSGVNNTSYTITLTQTGGTGSGTANEIVAYSIGEG
jgi:hypothetical protein